LLQTFVDGPCFVITGTRSCIDAVVATMIMVWRCLGFPLSYREGQLGTSVAWIGANLVLQPDVVLASIKQNILDDLKAQLALAMSSNVMSKNKLSIFGWPSQPCSYRWWYGGRSFSSFGQRCLLIPLLPFETAFGQGC
jgi:hypothetical protein